MDITLLPVGHHHHHYQSIVYEDDRTLNPFLGNAKSSFVNVNNHKSIH